MRVIIQPRAPKHREQYVATVTFMHGDGDVYTTTEIFLDTTEDVKLFAENIELLRRDTRLKNPASRQQRAFTMWFQSYQPADFAEDSAEDWWNKRLATYEDALAAGWGECYWPKDKTNHIDYAALSGVSYAWFDAEGIEHEVVLRKD